MGNLRGRGFVGQISVERSKTGCTSAWKPPLSSNCLVHIIDGVWIPLNFSYAACCSNCGRIITTQEYADDAIEPGGK